MYNWLNKRGYPIVTVQRNGTDITLTQKRFYLTKPINEDETHWWIPINYITEESPNITDTNATGWLEPEKQFVIRNLNESKWIRINNEQTGMPILFTTVI